ncbi:GlsB/YeaQ/YmgE family stress response membrane protein [Methylosinus sp. H3A]|uniref:GlsB/YeaQ/YmgE family stress response membrane protein n=1 Tax=Methylosinus sp. H3A TaxID=2785786 RepID=UPI0018C31566|nr:GlsB/YeaQ/YmgE family stress response membrane protein [Methylosinus sp. H3A]MBG0811583.1 GlsB/YeaQ/YmgE family stress response membrane protein [Methylosinus sp. H3A]
MEEAIGFLGRPDAGFLPLIVIGALVGWLVGALLWGTNSLFADMAIGVAGAWLGAKFADLGGLAAEGSIGHFLAGLLGSIIIVSLWARVDGENRRHGFGPQPRAPVPPGERPRR